jgi:hypothetical protein
MKNFVVWVKQDHSSGCATFNVYIQAKGLMEAEMQAKAQYGTLLINVMPA